MAFIDTYGQERAVAERNPEVVLFQNEVTVDGVTLPATLAMHRWQDGRVGDLLGTVVFSNLELVTPEPGAFDRPEDAIEDPPLPSF
jgi:hypothetical protein